MAKTELPRWKKDTYISRDPEKRARQLANLERGRRVPKNKAKRCQLDSRELRKMDIITFAEGPLGVKLYPCQRVVLKAVYGLPLVDDELSLYALLTGLARQHEIDYQAVESVLVLGARSGKSFLTSIMALYESICKGHIWRKYLAPGEVGYAVIIATRQKQAEDIIVRNAGRMLGQSKELAYWLEDEPLKAEISLRNNLKIIALPCNSTAGRGLPIFFLAFDEIGHYYTEGAKADVDIYNSLNPRRAQFPGAKTALISTPAAKQGLLWQWFSEGFTVPGRATFQAPTRIMNPSIPAEFLERAQRQDPDNYSREFEARFAERLSSFFDAAKIEQASILPDDLPWNPAFLYHCGIDQSGLTGRDRYALAVSHWDYDADEIIVDCLRSWNTTDINEIRNAIAEIACRYSLYQATVDRYAAGYATALIMDIGLEAIIREPLPQIYLNFKQLLNLGQVKLPANRELTDGLLNTTAFYGRNNSLSIQHERSSSGHADLADAVVTAVYQTSNYEVPSCGLIPVDGPI